MGRREGISGGVGSQPEAAWEVQTETQEKGTSKGSGRLNGFVRKLSIAKAKLDALPSQNL
jgi:hypothetical protein